MTAGTHLDLSVGLLGVNETGRVDLDFLHVDGVGAKGEGHLDTVTSRVVAVGGGQVVDVGTENKKSARNQPAVQKRMQSRVSAHRYFLRSESGVKSAA